MGEFVAEYGGELSFVVGSEQQARPHSHSAVGCHAGVERRNFEYVNSDTAAPILPDGAAKNAANIIVKAFVSNYERRISQTTFIFIGLHPKSALIDRAWLISGSIGR
jgi:hypothetical protein